MKHLIDFINESPSLSNIVSDMLWDKIKHKPAKDAGDIFYAFVNKCLTRSKDKEFKIEIKNALTRAEQISII